MGYGIGCIGYGIGFRAGLGGWVVVRVDWVYGVGQEGRDWGGDTGGLGCVRVF